MKHVQTEIEIEIILNIWQNVTYESRKRLTKWFENMEKLKLFDKMWPTEVVRGSQNDLKIWKEWNNWLKKLTKLSLENYWKTEL